MTETTFRVFNRRIDNLPQNAIYVGRPTKWGNPFAIGIDGTREEVIEKFRNNLTEKQKIAIKRELCGKHLVCWCVPLPCHANVLLEIANEANS